jgi:hypothetical protein
MPVKEKRHVSCMYRNRDAFGRWFGLERWADNFSGEEISPKERPEDNGRQSSRKIHHDYN